VLLLLFYLFDAFSPSPLTFLLSEDFFLTAQRLCVGQTTLFHYFFYSLFVVEFIIVNLILLIGLMATLLVSDFFTSRYQGNALSPRLFSMSRSLVSLATSKGPRTLRFLRRVSRRSSSGWVRG
jgi:hypothetical protein